MQLYMERNDSFFFYQLKGGFAQQGPRPTCDCRVFLVQDKFLQFCRVTRHTSCAHCCTMDPGPLSHPALHAHSARPLDLTLRVVRFSASRTPHTQTTLQFPELTIETSAVQAHYKSTATHRLHTFKCAIGDSDVKARGTQSPSEAKHISHHITALQHHFSRLLRHL